MTTNINITQTWWRLFSAVGSTLITLVAWLGYMALCMVVSFQVPFKGGEAGNTRFFGKILPNGVEIFSKTEGSTFYFQSPLPYLCTCTITVDAKRKDLVEERKSERQMKIETSRKFWTARLSHTLLSSEFL